MPEPVGGAEPRRVAETAMPPVRGARSLAAASSLVAALRARPGMTAVTTAAPYRVRSGSE